MKILQINETLKKKGGQERYFYDISKALEEQGHEVKMWAPKEEHNFLLRQWARFATDLPTYEELQKLIKEFKPDIIHLHGINRSTIPILWACEGIPTVMTVHNYGLCCPTIECVYRDDKTICNGKMGNQCARCINIFEFLLLKFHFAYRRRWLKRSVDKFITPSNRLKEYMEANDYNNVVQIPYFVDKNVVGKKKKKDIDVLYVGRGEPEKGLNVLYEALKMLPKEPKSVFVGDIKPNVKLLNAQFVGKVGFEDVKDYYTRAKMLVIPSIYMDNFPIVGLEGLANGIPIIGSDRGGIKEYASIVFDPLEPKQLADAISFFLEHKTERIRLGNDAKEESELYDKKDRVADVVEVYEQCLAS